MKKPKAIFMIYLIIALIFSISLIAPNVKADTNGCCELTKDGEYCLYTDKNNCDPSKKIATTTCEQTSYCQTGTCYSDDTGYCYPNTPRSRCEALAGTWSSEPIEALSQCKKGCCMISDQCSFITQTMCKRETSKYPGVSIIFDDSILTENECIDQCRSQEFGACVAYDKTCTFTTREACTETRQEGTHIGFHAGKLCSNPELGTNCAKQQDTNCFQGKVYWFDSCGNRENIYMSDKELSYNNGYILDESRTCTANPDDKTCGNCDYSKGTVCGEALDIEPTYGDYICRDINCKSTTESEASLDADGGGKNHGESWCLYEAVVAYGQDVVGSRHLKASCINGEEIIEPCKDYREEFCIQSVSGGEPTTDLGSLFNLGEGYSEALCIENRFEDCASCNGVGNIKDCCLDIKTKDCTILNGLCVPHVPPGLKFWEQESVKDVCASGRSICKVTYTKKAIGVTSGKSWKCFKGCECLQASWYVDANEKCVAQGDCGAYYNIEGEFTNEGINTGGRAIIDENAVDDWNDIKTPSLPRQKLTKGWWGLAVPSVILALIAWGTAASLIGIVVATTMVYTHTAMGWMAIGTVNEYAFGAAGFKASGAGGVFGFLGEVATGHGAAAVGVTGSGSWMLSALMFAVFWAAALYLLLELLDIVLPAKTKTDTIFVSCLPWEAPDKTSDCEKCNTGLAPCSEYRCRSLGKYCEIINEGTENEKCIFMNPHDTNSPIISSAQEDYGYTEIDLGYTITEEIPPFTPLILAITTDEPAKCKFSLDQGIPYEQIEFPFGEQLYDYEHIMPVPLPSELQDEEILRITNGGKYALYIKCIDKAGNDNKKDYYIEFQISTGPDFTPPKIELTSIENNAYIVADLDTIELAAYLNEPSKCRWSTSDTDYSAMTNTFTCVESGFDITSVYYGLYECITELPIELQTTNNYFFRCEDRSNNINVQSYPYTLVSTVPLKASLTGPTGMVYSAKPVLKITTSEGADNGKAFCAFSNEDDEIYNMIQFFETNSTEHTQQLGPITSGIHTYFIKCIDKAGNIAPDTTTFEVEADLIAPEIARIYKDVQQNVLVIELTEISNCEYSFEAFNYGSGIAMTGSNDYIHKASIDPENNIYFVACQDEYQNQIEFKVIS